MAALYVVEVSMPKQYVTVWASSGPKALRDAPWMIGAAGLSKFGTARVVAAEYGEDVSPLSGTAA